jgi:hypothetical protein
VRKGGGWNWFRIVSSGRVCYCHIELMGSATTWLNVWWTELAQDTVQYCRGYELFHIKQPAE